MLPTFTSFTDRHPRAVTVFGVALFVIGITLWAQTTLFQGATIVVDTVEEKPVSSVDEQIAILESLKSTDPDTQSVEEKIETLESLQSEAETTITPEEQMQILESLRAENAVSADSNETAL